MGENLRSAAERARRLGKHLGHTSISADWRASCNAMARVTPYGWGRSRRRTYKSYREAADKGEWDRFVMLMGGPEGET